MNAPLSEKLEWRRGNRIIAQVAGDTDVTDSGAVVDARDRKGSVEKELVDRARRGDRAAFEELFLRHQKMLFSYALGITGGREEAAEEILQEALLHAYRGIASFRGECAFTTWLWRILRNDFMAYRERMARWSEGSTEKGAAPVVEDSALSLDEEFIHRQRIQFLRQIVSRLETDDQEAITLIEFQGLSLDEAAVVTGMSLGAIKSRIRRARERLFLLVKKNKDLF